VLFQACCNKCEVLLYIYTYVMFYILTCNTHTLSALEIKLDMLKKSCNDLCSFYLHDLFQNLVYLKIYRSNLRNGWFFEVNYRYHAIIASYIFLLIL
jgi:hypothetical protein